MEYKDWESLKSLLETMQKCDFDIKKIIVENLTEIKQQRSIDSANIDKNFRYMAELLTEKNNKMAEIIDKKYKDLNERVATLEKKLEKRKA